MGWADEEDLGARAAPSFLDNTPGPLGDPKAQGAPCSPKTRGKFFPPALLLCISLG